MLRKWTFSNIHKDIALLNDNKKTKKCMLLLMMIEI